MKAILIYGGNSLITKNIIKLFYNEYEIFYIFTRNIKKTRDILRETNHYNKLIFIKNDLQNLNKTLINMKKIKKLCGIIWVAGLIENSNDKLNNFKLCQSMLKINFLNVVFVINFLLNKIILKKKILFV